MRNRKERIRDGLPTFQGRITKRGQRPYVRDFRKHVDIPDVSVPEILAGMLAPPYDSEVIKKPTESAAPQNWVPPRITNLRVERQMRGKGFKFKDGYPIHLPPGGSGSTFTNIECIYKYNQEGALFLVCERTTWNEQRAVQYESIIDQPLVRADGKPSKSMFQFHHGWINHMVSYRKKKLDAVRNVSPKIAAKRVAWFDDGVVVYTTTIGDLLVQSLSILGD